MERLDVLVRAVRDQTGNQQYTATQGIRQREFVRYANDAQMRIYNKILMERSTLYMRVGYLDVEANEAVCDLSTDIFLKHNILKVDYSQNGDARNYSPLTMRSPRQEVSAPGHPDSYFLRHGELVLSPIPTQSATRGLRLNYQYILPTLDIRRAEVTATQIVSELAPWRTRTAIGAAALAATFYVNGLYFIVGASGRLESSLDGITWTALTSGTAQTLREVTYQNGYYFVCGDAGALCVSADAVTWTLLSVGGASAVKTVRYSPVTGNWVCMVASGAFYSTQPLTTWSAGSGMTISVAGGLLYSDYTSMFIGVGGSGGSGVIYYSYDGVNWTSASNPLGAGNLAVVLEFNDTFIVGNTTGDIATSPDGLTWFTQTDPFGGTQINGGVVGENHAILFGNSGKLAYSTNGTSWTLIASGTAQHLNAATYSSGWFVAVGNSGSLVTSKDPSTQWFLRHWGSTSSPNLGGVCAGVLSSSTVRFVAVSASSNILTSSDVLTTGEYELALATPSGQLLNAETLEDLTGSWVDWFSIVDSEGTILANELEFVSYVSATRTLKVNSAESLLGLTGFLTFGKNSTTHSQLPEVAERYLSEYMAMRIQLRDSNTESINQSSVLRTLEEEIIDSIANLEEDLLSIAILDSSMMNYDEDL